MRKFKYIFIANLAEIARPFVSLITDPKKRQFELEEDYGLCDRFLISDRDNRVLVTSRPINNDFLVDTNKIFGFKNILNLAPSNQSVSICEDILNDKKLLNQLIEIIKRDKPVIYSYAGTKEFVNLINFLRKQNLQFKTLEMSKAGSENLVYFFGSKAGFRETFKKEKIGQGLNMQMPEGFIANNKDQLIKAAKYFFSQKKSFVIKVTSGLAGAGSEIVDISKIGNGDLEKYLEQLIIKYPYWQTEKTVIEDYINPDFSICGGSPSIEYSVGEKKTTYLYSCGMRIVDGGTFRGVEIGKKAVPLWIEKTMKAYGIRFAKIIQKAGYRGYFDTDFINTPDKKLFPLEANVRRTGGTHVYEAGIKLLGNNFLKKYYLVSNNLYENLSLNKTSYQNLKKKVSSVLYPINGKKKGIILTMVSLLTQNRFGYIVIGSSSKEAFKLEQKMERQLIIP